ncbi:MAG TPA: hypothetical protein VE870_12145 [Bacteroidales bacterium]|nr:hypothetical protein [Bacteroidales bacterium]
MIGKAIFIISSAIFINCYVYSQEQLIGFKSGFINPNFFKGEYLAKNSFLFMGFNYDYVPGKAIFSISAEIQYVNEPRWFLVPVSINFRPGNKIKFLASGGILPVIRTERVAPDKIIEAGGLCRTGIECKINKSVSLYTNFGLLFIPNRDYHYSHFGDKYLDKSIYRSQFINLGINYTFKKVED